MKNYAILAIILLGAFFVRIWRLDELLGFYYDQGRDAKVIWDLWHSGRFFLIGPTTGIEGIFRGPWYYWLIAPFYLIGSGNPVWSSIFLSLTTIAAIVLMYYLGKRVGGPVAGLLASLIAAFSFQIVYASRWLSNPTPMLFISMLYVWSLFSIVEGKKWAWISAGFLIGMAMQFGSAAEVFYLPVLIIMWVWLSKNRPNVRTLSLTLGALIVSFLPQIIFDARHDGILRNNVISFLFSGGSFKASFWEIVQKRGPFYLDLFGSKLFLGEKVYIAAFAIISGVLLFIQRKQLFTSKYFVTLLILFLSPIIGMLFFQGNYGNVYDYYFTGYYLVFILLFSIILVSFFSNPVGKILIATFILLFLSRNAPVVHNYITAGVDGPTTIALGNQKQAVDWVYKDAGGKAFNVDVYVPPVIPHAYDYLFLWWGTTRYGKTPSTEQIPLLYTLYEQDPPHPERLEAWLTRQGKIGKVVERVRFGGITVDRRERIQ